MSTAIISAFENTLHKTNVWIKDVLAELNWDESDHQRGYHALRAVLQTLRDRLTVEEASDFAAQLPMLIRGFYYEGWNPAHTPIPVFKKEDFLQRVADQFANDISFDVQDMTQAVFRVVEKHVTAGEIKDIKQCLPESIREMWSS